MVVCTGHLQDLEVELRPSDVHGNGLFARRDFERGDVIMSIPLDACLVMRRHPEELYTNSWRAPEDGNWKQVELGFVYHAEHGLPWDLVRPSPTPPPIIERLALHHSHLVSHLEVATGTSITVVVRLALLRRASQTIEPPHVGFRFAKDTARLKIAFPSGISPLDDRVPTQTLWHTCGCWLVRSTPAGEYVEHPYPYP